MAPIAADERMLVPWSPPALLVAPGPQTDALPETAGRVDVSAPVEGWRVAARMAVTIVDGPGEDGFAVQMAGSAREDDAAREDWLQRVDAAGGAVVLVVAAVPPADADVDLTALIARATRGGFAVGVSPG